MMRLLRLALPAAVDHTTSRGNAHAAMDAAAAERAAWLSLPPGWDKATLVDSGEPFWPSRHGEGCPDYRTMGLLSQQQRQSTAMAKLPNGERVRIPMEKLTDYCLNPDHPRGRDKARVFAALLGIT